MQWKFWQKKPAAAAPPPAEAPVYRTENKPPPPPETYVPPPPGEEPPLRVPPPPADHHLRYETPEPAPAYERPPPTGLQRLLRWLCLASHTPTPTHPYDQCSQPYHRDRLDAPIFIIRTCFLTLTVLEALLAAKPFEWGPNKYRAGPSRYAANGLQDPVFQSHTGFFAASFWLALVAAVTHLGLYVLCYKRLFLFSVSKYLWLIALQFFCLLCDSVSFVYPSTWRLVFGFLCEAFLLLAAAACGYVVWHWGFYDPAHNEIRYTDFTPAKVDPLWMDLMGWHFVQRVAQRLSVRRRLHAIHGTGQRLFIGIAILVLLVMGTTVSYEIWKTCTGQSPLYPQVAIQGQQNTYGLINWRQYQSKVLLVVVDGLRQDSFTSNANLAAFASAIAADSRSYPMTAAVPTANAGTWATLVSGVSPETTGLLGSYNPPEALAGLAFDTLFRETSVWSTNNMIASDPQFRDLVGPDLTPLVGDASVNSAYGTAGSGVYTTLPADTVKVARTQSALLGITAPATPALLLTHLNNVGMQAQWYGPQSQAYTSALDSLASQLFTLKATVDLLSNVSMIVTGSHGTAVARGFGGVSPSQQDVPFYLYSPGSGFATSTYAGAGTCPSADPPWTSVDVAPTVSALLNVPVPRQAEGSILTNALALIDAQAGTSAGVLPLYALQDLFLQKQNWYCSYFFSVFWGEDFFSCQSHYTGQTCLSGSNTTAAACDCLTAIQQLRGNYTAQRSHSLRIYFWRNWFLTLGFLFLFVLFAACCADLYTFVDLRSLLALRRTDVQDPLDAYEHTLRTTGGRVFLRPDWEESATGRLGTAANRRALGTAVALQLAYWLFVTIVFLVGYVIVGFFFSTFDESMINLNGDLLGWLAFCLVPGTLAAPLLTRAYKHNIYVYPRRDHVHVDDSEIPEAVRALFLRDLEGEDEGWEEDLDHPDPSRKLTTGTTPWLLDQETLIDNHVYLTKWYLAWSSLLINLALLWIASGFCSFIPVMFSMPWVTPFNWGYRFVVLSLMLMGFPLLVSAVVQVARWAPFSPWDDLWDGVFELQALKDMTRLRRHHAATRVQNRGAPHAAHLNRFVSRRAERLWPAWDILHKVSAQDMLGMDLKLDDKELDGFPLPQQQRLVEPLGDYPSLARFAPEGLLGRNPANTPKPMEKADFYDAADAQSPWGPDRAPLLPPPSSSY